jgi:hypothetical protein
MKNYITLCCLLLICQQSFGQKIRKVREVIALIPQQSIYLNSTSNGYFYGGTSRDVRKVDLPDNTVEWYYIFSTTPNQNSSTTLGLTSQLTMVFDPSGLTAVALNSLTQPTGTGGVIDLFVLDEQGRSRFLEKDMFGAWAYSEPGSGFEGRTINAKQGTVKIDDVKSGTIYLGLRNNDVNVGVNVNIEVAAIIEREEVDMSEWSNELKSIWLQYIYETNLRTLPNYTADGINKISECMIQKLVNQYQPSSLSNISDERAMNILQEIFNKCYEDLTGGAKTDDQKRASTYGSMGWKAYENGEIDKAISYGLKAYELDKTLVFNLTNLGLYNLINKDVDTALGYYIDAILYLSKDNLNSKYYLTEAIKDINNAKIKFPELSGYEEILNELQTELKRH